MRNLIEFYIYEAVALSLVVCGLVGVIFRLPLRMPGGQNLRGMGATIMYHIMIVVAGLSAYMVWQARPLAQN
jgi:hypothetical protein